MISYCLLLCKCKNIVVVAGEATPSILTDVEFHSAVKFSVTVASSFLHEVKLKVATKRIPIKDFK